MWAWSPPLATDERPSRTLFRAPQTRLWACLGRGIHGSVAKNTDEVIDVDEVLPEEIPAELLERVSEHHPYLTEIHLQVRRGSWRLLRHGKRVFKETPPPMAPHDICAHLVTVAAKDADVNGEGIRYRARLRCKQGDLAYTRYAHVRGYLDGSGALQIVDDVNDSEGDSGMASMIRAKEQSDQIAFQSLRAVLDATQATTKLATMVNTLVLGFGEMVAKQAGGEAELLRIKLEMEQAGYQHEEKMKKWDRGFGMLEKPVQRIGDEIMDTVVAAMREKRAKSRERTRKNGRRSSTTTTTTEPPKAEPTVQQVSQFAQNLDDVFANLTDSQKKQAQDAMTPDEWKLVQAARKARNDKSFDGIFGRFRDEVAKRGDKGSTEFIGNLGNIVGPEGMIEIGQLFQRIEQGRESANDAPPPAT